VSILAYQQPAFQRDSPAGQRANPFDQHFGIDDNTVGYDANGIRPDRAAGQKVQSEPAVTYDDRVSGVGPAAVSHDYVTVFGKNINHFPLAFVTPL
jgi:hypothetical protein